MSFPSALSRLGHLFPNKGRDQIVAEYPEGEAVLKEFQIFTLLRAGELFDDHQIWTRDEIGAVLRTSARKISLDMEGIYPNAKYSPY